MTKPIAKQSPKEGKKRGAIAGSVPKPISTASFILLNETPRSSVIISKIDYYADYYDCRN